MKCPKCKTEMEQQSVVVRTRRGDGVKVTTWYCQACGTEVPCQTEYVETEIPKLSEAELRALYLGRS